jgi:hypothetical protein
LFPPDNEKCLRDEHGKYLFDIHRVDAKQFPQFKQARRLEVIQEEGETLFVPSNWFHQVHNLVSRSCSCHKHAAFLCLLNDAFGLEEHTISINHNWGNAFNLNAMFAFLKSQFEECREALVDLKDILPPDEFDHQCQVLLGAHSGWSFVDFWKLCNAVATCYRSNHLWTGQIPENMELTYQGKSITYAEYSLVKLEAMRNELQQEVGYILL